LNGRAPMKLVGRLQSGWWFSATSTSSRNRVT
jgi:hypothetical protein